MNLEITRKQKSFIDATADEVLYGGAAGGGKSYGQLIDAFLYALKYQGSRQLILRRTFPELQRSLILTSLALYPREVAKYNEAKHVWRFRGGSIIEFGYCDTESDVTKYQSAEYDVIRFDELTHFTEFQYTYMLSRVRGTNNFPKQVKSTTNPGNVGHRFVKQRFISRCFPDKVYADETGRKFLYIPAKVYDNKFLMAADPGYIERLKQLPEDQQRALLDGDWDVYEGQAFGEFSREIHVIQPFIIPSHWRRWMANDPGYTDPFAWYWFAVDEDGTVYIYREYTRDYNDPKLTYSDQARRVKELCRYTDLDGQDKEEKLSFIVAGRDAWNTHPLAEDGKTIIDYYAQAGLTGFIKAITDRRLRKATWHEYLRPFVGPNGKPTARVKIFSTCKKLIETLPQQCEDENDPEKVAETNYDHWYDAAGYGLIAWHAIRSKRPAEEQTLIQRDKERLANGMKRQKRRIV